MYIKYDFMFCYEGILYASIKFWRDPKKFECENEVLTHNSNFVFGSIIIYFFTDS